MRFSARIGIVLTIAGAAIAAAIPFRKSATPGPSPQSAKLPIERRLHVEGESWSGRFQTAPLQAEPLRTLAVSGEGGSPDVPELPAKFHRISPVGALLNATEPPPDDEPNLLDTGAPARALTHKIVDGDTLSKLAERYWGDATLAGRLFEANRDVLKSPDLLPLGRLLKIPAREEVVASSPQADHTAPPMAPIPRGAFRGQ